MSNEKSIHNFKSMVSADSAEPWKRPLVLDVMVKAALDNVWAEQGAEPQPLSPFYYITPLLTEEGMNMKTGIYERGEIVTQPCGLFHVHRTKPNI